MIRVALAAAALALPAGPADADALEDCVLERFAAAHSPARAEAECTGLMTRPCMDRPEGQTTIGTIECVRREHEAWDALLNAYWPRLRDYAAGLDAAGAEGAAASLLAAQRAWLEFRDNECAFAYAEFTGGTFAPVTAAFCQRDMTARRAIEFIGRVGVPR